MAKRGESMPRWTEDEDALLFEYYPVEGKEWDGWGVLLPDRTPSSIACRANRIGLSYAGHRRRPRPATDADSLTERAVTAIGALGYDDRLRLCELFARAFDESGIIVCRRERK